MGSRAWSWGKDSSGHMETLIGIVTTEGTIVLADKTQCRSIIRYQDNVDKIMQLDDHKVMASAQKKGGDSSNFGEYVQKNLKLYELRTGTTLSTHASANFVRGELARYLRQKPYYVDLLIGGYDAAAGDNAGGPSLYYLDYLASMQKVPYACHGYAGYFCSSTIDRYYTPNLTLEEGMDILKKCVKEIQTRFLMNTPEFTVKVIDKDGVRVVPLN